MAETASATPNVNIVNGEWWCTSTATVAISTAASSTTIAIVRLKRSMRSVSGGLPAWTADIDAASRPTSVAAPVATTMPCALPRNTRVAANAQFARSDGGARSSASTVRVLGRRQGFAGQQRLVDLQSVTVQQPEVRRHVLAAFERDDVAPHELGGVDLAGHAVAHDGGADPQQALQRLALLFGIPFLPRPERRSSRTARSR